VAKVDDVGLTFITGGQREAIRIIPIRPSWRRRACRSPA
jgi:hypothetical protein